MLCSSLHFKKVPLSIQFSFEASTYGAQDDLKVWGFKQVILDEPTPTNLSGFMVDAIPIIKCAEVFPRNKTSALKLIGANCPTDQTKDLIESLRFV